MRTNPSTRRFFALLIAVVMLAAACGSSGGSSGDDQAIDDPTTDDTGAGDEPAEVDLDDLQNDDEPPAEPLGDGTPPIVGDHWHSPYGIFLCDGAVADFVPPFPQFDNPAGLYTLGEGLIHIEPFNAAGSGSNATLGLFFEAIGLELVDNGVGRDGEILEPGFDCNGEPTVLKVAKWNLAAIDAEPEVFTENLAAVPVDQNLDIFTIAYVAEGDEIPQPPSISQLALLTDVPPEEVPQLPAGFEPPPAPEVGTVAPVPAAPVAGAAITGETPCPTDDSERTTSFEQAPPDCLVPGVTYEAVITTTEGVLRVELDTETTPSTANNFIVLARYGYYDDTALFRTDPSIDIIQGGSPTTNSAGDPGPGYTIPDEGEFVDDPATGYTGPYTYELGDLVMARSGGPDASGAQIFFAAGPDTAVLDGQGTYLNFGDVIEGVDVLEAILGLHVDDPSSGLGGGPSRAVVIESVEIVES